MLTVLRCCSGYYYFTVAWAVIIIAHFATGEITAVVKCVLTTTVSFQVGPVVY